MKPFLSLRSLLSQARTGLLLAVGAQETAAMIGIGEATLWRLNSQGRIPAPVRLGRRTLWRVREIEDWLAAGCPARGAWRWPPEPGTT